jgi:hypothetical protein
MKEIVMSGKYKHYKGKEYVVKAIARDSDTLEDLVVYEGLYDSKEFGNHPVWVRPVSEFIEKVNVDGGVVPRFTFIEKV